VTRALHTQLLSHSGCSWHFFSYAQFDRAVDRLAAFYLPLVRTQSDPSTSSSSPPEQVIAVLVSTAIDETLLQIALSKLGLVPFLLSVNNSPAAVAHLVQVTNATHLIHSRKFLETATISKDELSSRGITIEILEDQRFPLWGPGGIDDVKIAKFSPRFTPDVEASRTGVILHSSGSVRLTFRCLQA
jgi:acyl-CoA synthetase (AMP-forming)/AMP-acid ligase II